MKAWNKTISQYENMSHPDHCVGEHLCEVF